MLVVAPALTIGGGAFTGLHPEEAYPDPENPSYADPYAGFISRVQEKLQVLGFDAGPVNGEFGSKTQAALAQFQLSVLIPASGQLDDRTLAELGVERDANAATEPDANAATERDANAATGGTGTP